LYAATRVLKALFSEFCASLTVVDWAFVMAIADSKMVSNRIMNSFDEALIPLTIP
jgi:hypothetical protein